MVHRHIFLAFIYVLGLPIVFSFLLPMVGTILETFTYLKTLTSSGFDPLISRIEFENELENSCYKCVGFKIGIGLMTGVVFAIGSVCSAVFTGEWPHEKNE